MMFSSIAAIYTGIFMKSVLFVIMLFMVKKLESKWNKKSLPIQKSTVIKGSVLLFLSLLLNVAETRYYGWNETAHSTGEWVLDILTGVLYLLSIAIIFFGFFPQMVFLFTTVKVTPLWVGDFIVVEVKFKNLLKSEYNELYLDFWMKGHPEQQNLILVERYQKNHRKAVFNYLKENHPELANIPSVKSFLQEENP